MKKMTKFLAMGVILIMCFGFFAGCGNYKLKIGTYITEDETSRIILSEENEFTFIRLAFNYAPTGKYSIKGNKLTLEVSDDEKYVFEIKNGNLVYENSEDVIVKGTVFKIVEK